ncbi:MAG TPA: type VI secretion system baseplate subunit TssF [Bryobacteraceae bacterium]|nr:type VI secretion system baseplate subunit TssF [Bryobacteraceae bacterium]
MRDELREYYESELNYVRQLGAEFAARNPKIAGRLLLPAEIGHCEDPHVERLIEGFAFLAARVRLKLDDEFPEIAESLLGILHPHYVRPIPSMSIVEFHTDDPTLNSTIDIAAGTRLYSRPVDGEPCIFRTGYPTSILPLAVTGAQWRPPDRLQPALNAGDAAYVCRLELTCNPDVTFAAIGLKTLRFYLAGDSQLAHTLYELLDNNCLRVVLRDPAAENPHPPVTLSKKNLRAMGFSDREALLPMPLRSFTGYRLLQEYFALPEKFFFFELKGLEPLAEFGSRAEILFLIAADPRRDREQMMELRVNANTFRLNCSPIINLFDHTTDGFLLDPTKYEHLIIPDVRRRNALEIFSIDQVLLSRSSSQDVVEFEPFYAFRHSRGTEAQKTFYHASRRPSARPNDEGTDIWLTLVDLSGRVPRPAEDTITVRSTCTNRDLPSHLRFADPAGDFELERGSVVRRIVCLKKPTDTLRPPDGRALLWRQVSHLSLNYLSLVEHGKEALQEMLRVYNFSEGKADSAYLDRQISGISSVSSRRHFARVSSPEGISFARGTRVDMELDEEQFVGGGVYLFASILEHFLGLYVTLNSFSQLAVRTKQRKEPLRVWPPRAGHRILL